MSRFFSLGDWSIGQSIGTLASVSVPPVNIQDLFPLELTGLISLQSSSPQFSHSVMCNSLWPPGLQHARLPCPSPTPGACSNSRPSSQWCHPNISSSVIFSSCCQSFPALGSFPMFWLFPSDGQSIGVQVLEPKNCSPRDSLKSLAQHFKSVNSLVLNFLNDPTLTPTHNYLKIHSFD